MEKDKDFKKLSLMMQQIQPQSSNLEKKKLKEVIYLNKKRNLIKVHF